MYDSLSFSVRPEPAAIPYPLSGSCKAVTQLSASCPPSPPTWLRHCRLSSAQPSGCPWPTRCFVRRVPPLVPQARHSPHHPPPPHPPYPHHSLRPKLATPPSVLHFLHSRRHQTFCIFIQIATGRDGNGFLFNSLALSTTSIALEHGSIDRGTASSIRSKHTRPRSRPSSAVPIARIS